MVVLTGIDGLYNSLLLGAVNDTKGLAASAMNFAPGMWLDPLLDSGNGFGAMASEIVFAAADFDCSEFPYISKVEGSSNEGFNDWGGRGYDDFVPREVTKTTPCGDRTT